MFGLSKTEAVFIIVLLLCVIGFSVYRFVYIPKTEEMRALENELTQIGLARLDAEIKIMMIPMLENEIEIAESVAYEGAPLFFDSIEQHDYIVMLTELAEKAQLDAVSYNFPDPAPGNITVIGANTVTSANLSNAANQLLMNSVNISFEGAYDKFLGYLRELEGFSKALVVSDLNVSGHADGTVSGSLTLEFYELPKIFPDGSDLFYKDWAYETPAGRDSIFFDGTRTNLTTDILSQKVNAFYEDNQEIRNLADSYDNPDFYIFARAMSSALPAMTIGHAQEDMSVTYLRTSVEAENVTLELTAENGEYYYRYYTETKSYPASGSERFVPVNDDIRLVIYSDRRTGSEDTNTIDLTIINNTGLLLNWIVIGDDKTTPRISVTEQ